MLPVSRSEVGMRGDHSNRLVSHQFLHCLRVYPTHHQTASEGVPQGVPGGVFDLNLFERGREPLAGILDQVLTLGMELRVESGECSPSRL